MNQGTVRPIVVAWKALLLACPVVFVGLAAIGGIRRYSPVPYWDMWDSYLRFFIVATSGDVAVWWAQHNEHRIVFSKLLFWIDLALMDGGSTPFLIICNFLLAAASVLVFHRFLKALLGGADARSIRVVITALVCVLGFSWVQEENFKWAFQSSFFSAQVFPLTAFYLLGRSMSGPAGCWVRFGGACAMGVASAGTLASGVAVLPIMALTTLIARPKAWKKQFILAGLFAVVAIAYFHDYRPPGTHGQLLPTLMDHPGKLLRFIVLYLGNPAFFFVNGVSVLAATLAGIITLLAVIFMVLKVLLVKRPDPMMMSLLAFAGYLLATAIAVAGGRLIFGLEAALSSRYSTPALMLWCALLVLYAAYFDQHGSRQMRRHATATSGLVVATSLLLLPSQLRALEFDRPAKFDSMIAALALEMGVHDAAAIGRVYPLPEVVMKTAREPSRRDLSIFGHPSIKDASLSLGQLVRENPKASCAGHLDVILEVDRDPRFLKVSGWIFDQVSRTAPHSASVVDREGEIIGHVITGASRPDVASAVDGKAKRSGFTGYVLTKHRDSIGFLDALGLACRVAVTIPVGTRNPG